MKPITYEIKGIKCDNKSCDYEDSEAEFDMDKYLNAPCPKCGSNLFTEKDYALMKAMLANADLANQLASDLDLREDDKAIYFNVEMNGSGIPNITLRGIDK